MTTIPNVSAKGIPIHAVGDTGSQVTLVTLEAAQCLGLHITWHLCPLLKPLWPDSTPHVTYGHANIELHVENSPRAWAHAVVINWCCHWEVLLGRDMLVTLGVSPASPAMLRRSNGATTIPDHAGKHIDGLWHCTTEAAYEDFPDMAPSHGLATTVTAEPSATTAQIPEPMHAHLMCAQLALPTGIFVKEHDDEFVRLDALYPEVTPDSISKQMHHQCMSGASAQVLAAKLWTAHSVLPATREAVENAVQVHLQYGIDEASEAFSQLLIFTKSKPGTDECQVLFDNSSNNCLNMCSIGMQLPRPAECVQFLHNACIVSSINMASFFTQLCLATDVADFWVYDGTRYGKLRTQCMVQGNSESPAIAQAFLTFILGTAESLYSKLLVYIDNVYLKDMAGNKVVHIMDIGIMLCCLAAANITVNMRKSLWCATSGIVVLGHSWSADCSWALFDHCVITLQGMDFPVMVSSIQCLCSGINSISEHIPWSQALLVPFYETTGKVRLTKADQDALHELWYALQ
ncbi:hypothetical protein LPJ61_004599 [Coemansia biformis]|uniref:Reverse transcriptase domain-containing protein n=1 Tax=Coemansia biformis TaxID=1286918 RepID=A0A9W7Y4J0_9FUNG|nr:hypothetical protein LPJ61_004599 [Coemansia biformis]